MPDVFRFLRSLVRHWSAWLTGGVLAAIFGAGQGLHLFTVTPPLYAVFGVIAAGLASYTTWRDEARRAEAAIAELAKCRADAAALDNEVIPDVSDPIYWLLAVARKGGLRRGGLTPAHTGGTLYAIWIGETPVSFRDSRWLYELVSKAEERGLLALEPRPGGGGPYRMAHESTRILEVSRRRKRAIPEAPGTLHDARDGQPFSLPPLA